MDYKKELDEAYSLYIRWRDADDNGYIRCISCGRVLPFSSFDCGHYFSRRHLATRWDEHNCNAQCIECNRHRDGNLENYRRNLIRKIGLPAFEALEKRHSTIDHEPTDEEYEILIAGYRDCARRLSRLKRVF